MPEVQGPDKETSKQREFMREKIIKQPMTKEQIAKRAVLILLLAVMFGIIAAVSFVLTKPIAEKLLLKDVPEETIPITIPKDEPEPSSEPVSTEETEPIEDVIQSAMDDYEFSAESLNKLYANLRSLYQEADKGIVVVHSVKQQKDWFDNTVESAGQYAGAVIASSRDELLILTPEAAVEEADSIRVTFPDGTEVAGAIKQSDRIAGLAVVSIRREDIDEDALNDIVILKLGNSFSVKQGDMVVAIGSPSGIVHSTAYGYINYVTKNMQIIDGYTRLFYSDLNGNAKKGTFLINLAGEVIGWMTDEYKTDENLGYTAIMPISDYKTTLEKLSNGVQAPYMGIVGQEVSAEMAESGLPNGIYVMNSISDSPAYNAGIQNGDIITSIAGKNITTLKEFQTQLYDIPVNQVVDVVVSRNGIEEYTEIQFQVTIGAR